MRYRKRILQSSFLPIRSSLDIQLNYNKSHRIGHMIDLNNP